ncbi:MAG: class I SAM-dependent methyltransferase, partial [Coprobacillus sp.]
ESATRKYDFVVKNVEWISSMFPTQQYHKLFDLGCGPGIYPELFKQKGYRVIGMDISQNSIEYAKNSAEKKKLDIEYYLGDYITDDFVQACDLITLIYCDFGVLSTYHREKLLTKVYQSLLPNGCFVFDVFTIKNYLNKQESNTWEVQEHGFWSDKQYLLLHSFYRYDDYQTFLNKYVVLEGDNVRHYHIWEHTFTYNELEIILKKIGFKDIKFYGDLTGAKCQLDDETICIVARK